MVNAQPVDSKVPDVAVERYPDRLSAANVLEIMAELRRSIDEVFLPRPLLLVDALPRDETGKLPRSSLLALYRGLRRS